MRWEPRRAMNKRPMNILEARISRLQPWRVSTIWLGVVLWATVPPEAQQCRECAEIYASGCFGEGECGGVVEEYEFAR